MNARVETLFTLPPAAFSPPPDVFSTVLRLEFAPRFVELGVDAAGFDAFLKTCFAQKRKTLANNLRAAGYSTDALHQAWPQEIPPQARAESLALEPMAKLYRELGLSRFRGPRLALLRAAGCDAAGGGGARRMRRWGRRRVANRSVAEVPRCREGDGARCMARSAERGPAAAACCEGGELRPAGAAVMGVGSAAGGEGCTGETAVDWPLLAGWTLQARSGCRSGDGNRGGGPARGLRQR